MTLVSKLSAYRMALLRWRAAWNYIQYHPPACPYKKQPSPRDYGLNTEHELEMSNEILTQIMSIQYHPEKPLEIHAAKRKRNL